MKTLQELYKEITSNDELKKGFLEAAKDGKGLEFLASHGCETTAEELAAFLNGQKNCEISDEELDAVAGGTCNKQTGTEVAASILLIGFGCAVAAMVSSELGHVGQETDEEGRLCTEKK